MSVYAEGAPNGRPGPLRAGHPGAGLLLRHPGDGPGAGRSGSRNRHLGVRLRRRSASSSPACCCDGLEAEEQCWMSHRDCVTEAPPGFTVCRQHGTPVAAMEDRRRSFTRRSSTPRSRTPRVARMSCATSSTNARGHAHAGRRSIIEEQSRRSAIASATPGSPRAVRRRGLVGRRAARTAPSATNSPVSSSTTA